VFRSTGASLRQRHSSGLVEKLEVVQNEKHENTRSIKGKLILENPCEKFGAANTLENLANVGKYFFIIDIILHM
jgi:hypothetical protein